MIRARRARIVATIGPASRDRVRELALAGADVFRVNFSHGSHADHARSISAVRRAEAQVDRPLAVLADLQPERGELIAAELRELQHEIDLPVARTDSPVVDRDSEAR